MQYLELFQIRRIPQTMKQYLEIVIQIAKMQAQGSQVFEYREINMINNWHHLKSRYNLLNHPEFQTN
jgi:hypothetical protein